MWVRDLILYVVFRMTSLIKYVFHEYISLMFKLIDVSYQEVHTVFIFTLIFHILVSFLTNKLRHLLDEEMEAYLCSINTDKDEYFLMKWRAKRVILFIFNLIWSLHFIYWFIPFLLVEIINPSLGLINWIIYLWEITNNGK